MAGFGSARLLSSSGGRSFCERGEEAWGPMSDTKIPGPEPTGPELPPIRAIHRHADGVITFHRKTADGFENLFGVRSEYLEGMFPEFQEQLECDSYFSINAFWHQEKNRHYLNAAKT